MNSEMFLKKHRKTWEELDSILSQINKKGLSGLDEDKLKALGVLFRRTASHLAIAQTNYPEHEMVDYLNNLVVKVQGYIYKQETMGLSPILNFFRRGFPSLVKQEFRYISAAGLILLLGVIIGYFLHFFQPSLDGWIVPESVQKTITDSIGHGQIGAEWPLASRPAISTMIMLNNIQVGILSFALGFTCGIGTVLILFKNGLMLGVLGAFFASLGVKLDFWSLILPHGVLELLAIFICGGAGLVFAKALVKPGDYKRRDALLVLGKLAVKMVIGTIPMFIIAGLIEGFITPSHLANYYKLTFGASSMFAFGLYIFWGSKERNSKSRGE